MQNLVFNQRNTGINIYFIEREVEISDHNVCMKMETIQLDWGNSASAFFVSLMEHKSTLENTESLLSKLLVAPYVTGNSDFFTLNY